MKTAKQRLIELIDRLDEQQILYLLSFIPKRFRLEIKN